MTAISEQEVLRQELEELKEKYSFLLAAVDHLPNPIFMKDKNARFFFFNRAYSKFFDMERDDYLGSTVLDLDYLPMEERQRFQDEDLRMIQELDTISYDTSFTTSDGVEHPSFYWSSGFMDDSTESHGLVGEIVDISKERVLRKSLDDSLKKLKDANERLKAMAETDPVSGLYNRTVMLEKGREAVEYTAGTTSKACMLMIDIDRFKLINDEYGHLEGDRVLAKLADILRSECHRRDVPIRYGGDEFLLIISDADLEKGAEIGERIRRRCEEDLTMEGGRRVTVSVGVVEIDAGEDFEKNLSKLDEQLYRAKIKRNLVVAG